MSPGAADRCPHLHLAAMREGLPQREELGPGADQARQPLGGVKNFLSKIKNID